MVEILLTLFAMALCLLAEGFFSGSEIGIVSADKLKLRHEASQGSTGAKLALKMLDKPEWLLSTTLVGTNIFVVTNTTLATGLMIGLFGEHGSWLAVLIVAPLIWIFGEIVPKSVFQQKANVITPIVILPLRVCMLLFSPFLLVFTSLARGVSKLVGSGSDSTNPFTHRQEIMTMIQMSGDESDIEPIEQDMIRRMFGFSETMAREVMVPLIEVVGAERSMQVGEVVGLAMKHAHKRLPVYEERVDKVVGMIDAMELLGIDSAQPVEPFVRPVAFVAEAKSIQALLVDLRKSRQLMAVVVDEFGGAAGIVTVEDIVEEVVREVQDEYDLQEAPNQWMRQLAERDYLVSARIDLDTVGELLQMAFPEGPYTTLGGFLLEKHGDIPPLETTIRYQDVEFRVASGTSQSIKEVRITW